MRASGDDLAVLLNLQQVDMELLRTNKELAELPQRQAIVALRGKMRAIEENRDKVAELRKDTERKLSRVSDEDEALARKQRDVQAAIEESRADYRSVEARTKELNGLAKRRAALEEELDKLGGELAKIGVLETRVNDAYDEVARQEAAQVASFQKEGGALKTAAARLGAQRNALSQLVPASLLAEYEKAAKRSGGVAVARLVDARCGACRAVIDGGRLIELKNQAPLGTCPYCKRLLIV